MIASSRRGCFLSVACYLYLICNSGLWISMRFRVFKACYLSLCLLSLLSSHISLRNSIWNTDIPLSFLCFQYQNPLVISTASICSFNISCCLTLWCWVRRELEIPSGFYHFQNSIFSLASSISSASVSLSLFPLLPFFFFFLPHSIYCSACR